MVQHIEGFQPKSHIQTFMDGEYPRDLCVELVACPSAEGIAADVAVGSVARAGQRAELLGIWIERAPRSDLSERVWIQISMVSIRLNSLVEIDRHSGNEIWTVVANCSERVVLPRCYGEWSATDDMRERSEFPVVDE